MLKIRMQRTGRRNDPAFRLVVGEHTIGPKSGKFKEKLGSYHPKTKEKVLDKERIQYWLSVGAQTTDRVHNMLVAEGIIDGKKVNVLPKKSPIAKEQPEEAAPAPADAETEATEEAANAPAEESEAPAEEAPAEAEEEKKDA